MSEYIITCDDEVASWVGNDVDSMKPIVRCSDCKFYVEPFCERLRDTWGNIESFNVEPDGFCAWGERRDT